MGSKLKRVHLMIDEELYHKVWEIVKRRFPVPTKKLHIVVNEALREYIERHGEEYGVRLGE